QVFGFVRSSGGHVAIASEIGIGTTVSMYLPRSTAAPGRTAPPADDTAPLRPASDGECVLAVEDDAHVIATTAESLRDLGYSVLTAETAQEALEVLRQGTRIDILFSDVVMPGGMNGVQLAVEARRLRPGLRVLLTSGYTGAALDAHAVPQELPLLGKPYGREELADKLRIVLRER
ncbi:MAG: response regulator, partial [Pseudomonadota bacterium]|nr:response regulator [Pseudomonadota bacterium]